MSQTVRRRHLAAALCGNALEFYDFTTYAFFAVQIGHVFFPVHSAFGSLMLSLATFGVGFAGRPLGGILIGAYGDRAGRKPAMLLSFALMGGAILVLALTPSYAAIGLLAPAVVVAARFVQGFALGGEVGPSTAFLMEAATPRTRGFYTSLQLGSQGLATLAGGTAGIILSNLLDASALESYGWRIAFLLGGSALPFGLYLRRALPETLELRSPFSSPTAEVKARPLQGHWRVVVLSLVMLASATICIYTLSYLTTYASSTLHMRANISFAATAVFGLCNMTFSPISGWLSDRIGRRPVMVWPRVLLLLSVYPAFLLMIRNRDAATLLCATAIIATLNALSAGATLAAITEALPLRVRSASLGTVYAIAIAAFGGTTQLIITWLLHVTNSPLAPAWYLTGATLIGAVAMALMKETAPVTIAV